LLAGVAEDVLGDALALAARPVDGGAALLLGHVPEPVDGTFRSLCSFCQFSGISIGVETNWMPMPMAAVASQMFSTAAPIPKTE
jgi:hypothetical protein